MLVCEVFSQLLLTFFGNCVILIRERYTLFAKASFTILKKILKWGTGMDNSLINSICKKFRIPGELQHCKQLTSGHINNTYIVSFLHENEQRDYILQKLNTYVFTHPVEVMENIASVTKFIRHKLKAKNLPSHEIDRMVLHFQHTDEGYYFTDGTGFWRCYRFVDNSITFDITDDLKVIEEAGSGFGEFQMHLADYPVENLHIAIPHFHNTVNRYKLFSEAIAQNKSGRLSQVSAEISAFRALEEQATSMYRMQKAGELPLKVTHNDTKTNNVLFDKSTRSHLAVLDLDTVMPGLVGFDFGDAIRFIGNTADEDEKDLSKVGIDMEKYKAFTKGFVSVVGHTLSESEKDTLALGAFTMAVECGVRFLTDYLDGDVYFKTEYPEHNLDRARCQLALAQDIQKHLPEMQAIVRSYC